MCLLNSNSCDDFWSELESKSLSGRGYSLCAYFSASYPTMLSNTLTAINTFPFLLFPWTCFHICSSSSLKLKYSIPRELHRLLTLPPDCLILNQSKTYKSHSYYRANIFLLVNINILMIKNIFKSTVKVIIYQISFLSSASLTMPQQNSNWKYPARDSSIILKNKS